MGTSMPTATACWALRLEFDIPSLGRGTAALVVTAAHDIGRAELKQLL
jgi:hypothetical protein